LFHSNTDIKIEPLQSGAQLDCFGSSGEASKLAGDSETDAHPIGRVRKEWNRGALEEKDREIAEAERFYRDSAMSAAAELIRLLDAPS